MVIDKIFNEISIEIIKGKYKSIVISNLLEEAIVKQYYIENGCNVCYLLGLPCIVSHDLDFTDYQLLKFDITKIKGGNVK